MAFSGWPEEALDFYDGLVADNTKTYWTEHKAVYTEKILGPMTDLTALGTPSTTRRRSRASPSAGRWPTSTIRRVAHG